MILDYYLIKINKILYNKYKNNLITQKEYTNLLSKINNV